MREQETQRENKSNTNLYEGKLLYKNRLYTKAVAFLKKAYAEGCLEAACKLGIVYMNRHFLNYEKAFYWFSIAAEGGNPEAQFHLSQFYEKDLLEKYDLDLAHQWLMRAVEQNEPNAMLHLSFLCRMGIYVPKDQEKALSLLLQLAETGHPEALCQLGKEYESGGLVSEDSHKSLEYYKKAAEKHHPYALYKLGKYYWNEHLSEGNVRKAVKCLEESSQKGCCEAQYLLANICGTYFHHHIFDRYCLLKAAAKNGHPEAMYDLGCLYLFGNSFLPADMEQAKFWFDKANENGLQEKLKSGSSLQADFGCGRFNQ